MAAPNTVWNDLSHGALDLISNVANFFGLGGVVTWLKDQMYGVVSTKQFNDIIDKMILEAKAKGTKVYNELLSRLQSIGSSLPPNLSNSLKAIVLENQNKLRDRVSNIESKMTAAQEYEAQARQSASTADMLPSGERATGSHSQKNIAITVDNAANKAAKLYNEIGEEKL